MADKEYPVQEQDLRALEIRVEELIRACAHLKDDNKTLRAQVEQLSVERDKLLENNAAARVRVESLIDRLKSIETGS
jgi:cell division protein ZapB